MASNMYDDALVLREGFLEELRKEYDIWGPYKFAIGRKTNGIVQYLCFAHDRKRKTKIHYYRTHIDIDIDGEVHRAIIAFDPAHGGPHCEEKHPNGDERKNMLPFDFHPIYGFKRAWDDANKRIVRKHREYAQNYKDGAWPENAYG